MFSSTAPPPSPGISADGPLASLLSSLLPSTLSLKLYHISTPPSRHFPLFSSPPNQDPHRTTLESHFLVLSHENILVFAIEVLIYTIPKQHTRTFFVSKADSSGYLPSNVSSFDTEAGERKSTLRTISTAFIKYLFDTARRADPHLTATISLFARSQSQYLFPNSAENDKKHVLTDRGLIAWWGKVLDPVLQEYASSGGKGYLLVPGFDAGQTRSMIPSVAKGGVKWINGHPFKLNLDNDVSVREVIPHFPDDPKARYLDELNGVAGSKDAGMGGGGKVKERAVGWRDIRTIEQFWELMSFRQECSLGRCVGFLWLVVEGIKKERKMTSAGLGGEGIPEDEVVFSPTSATGLTFSENVLGVAATASSSSSQEMSPIESVGPLDSTTTSPPPPADAPTPAPTPPSPASSPRKRRNSSAASFQTSKKKLRALSFSSTTTSTATPLIPPLLTLDEKAYAKTVDSLLNHSDFGDVEGAKKGSRKWIESVQPGVVEKGDWGVGIVGQVKAAGNAKEESGQGIGTGNAAVNTLSAGLVRRKSSTSGNGVNLLDAGLVRKKSKTAENGKLPGVSEEQKQNGVNVLPASLLRKGSKPREEARVDTVVNVLPTNLVRKKPKVGE